MGTTLGAFSALTQFIPPNDALSCIVFLKLLPSRNCFLLLVAEKCCGFNDPQSDAVSATAPVDQWGRSMGNKQFS